MTIKKGTITFMPACLKSEGEYSNPLCAPEYAQGRSLLIVVLSLGFFVYYA